MQKKMFKLGANLLFNSLTLYLHYIYIYIYKGQQHDELYGIELGLFISFSASSPLDLLARLETSAD